MDKEILLKVFTALLGSFIYSTWFYLFAKEKDSPKILATKIVFVLLNAMYMIIH